MTKTQLVAVFLLHVGLIGVIFGVFVLFGGGWAALTFGVLALCGGIILYDPDGGKPGG